MAGGAGHPTLAASMVAALANETGKAGVGETLVDLLKKLLESGGEDAAKVAGAAGATAAATFGAPVLVPLAIYLTLFGVTEAFKHRREKADVQADEEAHRHLARVLEQVKGLLAGQAQAQERLIALAESTNRAAGRLYKRDRAQLTADLAEAIRPSLQLLGADEREAVAALPVFLNELDLRLREVQADLRDFRAEANVKLNELLARRADGGGLGVRGDPDPHGSSNLPPLSPNLVPREDITSAIHDVLSAPGLTGAVHQAAARANGGYGKTVAALLYAHEHAADYAGGRFFLSMEKADFTLQLASLGRFFDVPDSAKPAEAAPRVCHALQTGLPSLLILDNVADAGQWKQIAETGLLPGGGCRVLITTRAEHIPKTAMVPVGRLTKKEARAIYARFCDGTRDAPDDATADQITEWLEGLAVAVAAVAARMKLKPQSAWPSYADKLATLRVDQLPDADERVRAELGEGSKGLAERRRTLKVIDDAFDALPPHPAPERRCVQYAALLPPDHVPQRWLIDLLEADARQHEGVSLTTAADDDSDPAGTAVEHLRQLDVLATKGEEKQLLSLHRLWRERVREQLDADIQKKQAMLLTLARHAAQRSSWLSNSGADHIERWIDVDNRWELLPLLFLVTPPSELDFNHPNVATTLNNVAICLQSLGRSQEALPMLEEALEMRRRLFKWDHPDVAMSLNNLAACLRSLGRGQEALSKYEAALKMMELLFRGDHPYVALCLGSVAFCLELLGRSQEALPKYEAALQMHQRLFNGDHPAVATSLNDVAFCLDSLGRGWEALLIFKAALEMRQRLFTGDHPAVATSFNNLAACLDSLGRGQEALSKYEAALEMRQRLFDGDHPSVATSLNNVAAGLQTLDRGQEALPMHEAALEMRQRLFKGDHPDVATSLNNVAFCLRSLGRVQEALPKYEAALEMRRRLFKGDHPDVATGLNNFAAVLINLEKVEKARPLIREAAEMALRIYPPGHATLQAILHGKKVICGE